MRRVKDKPALSDQLTRLELIVDAKEMARRDFLIEPNGVRAVVDTVIVDCLTSCVESKGSTGPKSKLSDRGDTVERPDVFLRGLARTGAIGISYLTLYESLDPRKPSKKDRRRPELDYQVYRLNADEKEVMMNRIQRLKDFNIRVVDVSSRAFRTALDMWFDTRQGMIVEKDDPFLFDPIIAATAMVTGAQLYSANTRDFAPYSEQYELNFTSVVQDGHYLGLARAA